VRGQFPRHILKSLEGGIAFCNFASLRQNGNKFFFGGKFSLFEF